MKLMARRFRVLATTGKRENPFVQAGGGQGPLYGRRGVRLIRRDVSAPKALQPKVNPFRGWFAVELGR